MVALTWCDAESNDHPERVRPGKDCYTQSDLAFFVAHRMGSSFLIYVCGALGSIKKSCFAGGLTHVGVRHISTETRNVSIVQSRFFFHISFSSPAAESVRTKQSLKEYGVFCLSSKFMAGHFVLSQLLSCAFVMFGHAVFSLETSYFFW